MGKELVEKLHPFLKINRCMGRLSMFLSLGMVSSIFIFEVGHDQSS